MQDSIGSNTGSSHSKTYRIVRGILLVCLLSIATYGLASYGVLPSAWKFYESKHPALDLAPTRAFTVQGIPGDPINLAFIGTQEDLMNAAKAAKWVPADPITWVTSARIVVNSAIHRAYETAPVSDLFVYGKKQDLAFEQAHGRDPSQRHHARFWKSEILDALGRPLWFGAATFDSGVGVSHRTGQVTHHIDADVDRERDKIAQDLLAGAKLTMQWIDGFHAQLKGKNGGGDPYFTDGRLCVVVAPDGGLLDSAQQLLSSALSVLSDTLSP